MQLYLKKIGKRHLHGNWTRDQLVLLRVLSVAHPCAPPFLSHAVLSIGNCMSMVMPLFSNAVACRKNNLYSVLIARDILAI